MLSTLDVPIPAAFAGFRRFPLDDALLLFDRDTGRNALCEGEETRGLRQLAPRSLQFAITNRCNLACGFCSRDQDAASAWTAETSFAFLKEAADLGVLEVAFGGGEPTVFPGFADLVRRLHDETPLAVGFTTNGLGLSDRFLAAIRGKVGQFRLSLYDGQDWRGTVARLADRRAGFGVNWLVTPERLPGFEATVLDLAARGCGDILVLCYKGEDRGLHLSPAQARDLAGRLAPLARALAPRVALKLDICWGERMQPVPQILRRADCGAGRDFVVITSDRRLQPCSFHHLTIPIDDARGLIDTWRGRAGDLASAAHRPGCARLATYGLGN